MKNIQLFLKKISMWVKEEGFLFVDHVCHKVFAESFEAIDCDDWYSEYLFPKGSIILPAASTILYFQDDVSVVSHWIVNGKHMARTQEKWLMKLLNNLDSARDVLKIALGSTEAADKCINHCRTFNLAMREQFSHNNGEEWMISHILFKKN
ncbi:(S)-tetrahydroprotoberberine N-methyltransferase [Thalictrum thalictroides]|uniref:(S)-tetrahydroprotoberberine N-methyltransferase n=1 Tax=Thalictrum thalictroides TaxID=46969 RepID=A0A7J6W7N8_THATH|nr:(S)-tetrahydroprotoberberine N-methyltransferase [Thalictrum thalictroides]